MVMPRVLDRATLDSYLNDIDLTLLVVVGDDGTEAEKIHECAEEGIGEEWRVCLLLADVALLTRAEKRDWELADQRFVSLGVTDADERIAAQVGSNGELMRVDGNASILRIRSAFAKGDSVTA